MQTLTPQFELGHVVTTRGIAVEVGEDRHKEAVILGCLARHNRGDFGDMVEDDVLANLRAVLHGGERVFSAYDTDLGRIWIITEADRSATTVLFPHEY